MTRDPFTVLGVGEDADDAAIRQRYLALVRDYPPDRAPERFRAYRAAYEAISDDRKRLEAKLLRTSSVALARLGVAALNAAPPNPARAAKRTLAAVLAEGIMRTASERLAPAQESNGGR